VKIEQLVDLEAVALQMNQLFYNLIGNALKFARKGVAPVICISGHKMEPEQLKKFETLDSGRDYYKIEVRDNGVGFNQKYADKIFTIFQRLNDNSIHGGYGIGLAICNKVVQNHKGVIFATGTEYEGACFTIILPFKHH
jgi:two-component system CheB/CheR fusion protein